MSLLLLLASAQDTIVEGLRSEDPAVRETVDASLRALPTSRVPDLKAAWEGERDPEVKARLHGILKHLRLRESEALYQAGNLEECLRKQLEAEGALDIGAEHARRSKAAKEAIERLIPPLAERLVHVVRRPAEDAAALLKSHGRWVLPALLEELRSDRAVDRIFESSQVLRALRTPMAPAVRWALRSARGDKHFESRCIELLNYDQVELRLVMEDATLSPHARNQAGDYLGAR